MTNPEAYRAAGTVRLKRGREAALLRGHPWVYRGALAEPVPAGLAPLLVVAADGRPLGSALPGSSGGSLVLRMVTAAGEEWSREALKERLESAFALRRRLGIDGDAMRLVHAEGDRLPGLVIDRYADCAVVQPFEAAWEPYLEDVATVLEATGGVQTTLVRRPGQAGSVRALRGTIPARPVVVREGDVRYPVDLVAGQKTGFFLDQRDNRRRCAELAGGGRMLNLFSYSGGFAVAAVVGGALAAVNVEASVGALELAREAYRLNGLPVDDSSFVAGDAFRVSREMAASGMRFETVVADPPAFVKRKQDLRRGLEGYRDVNLQALKLVAADGLLVTCSCSALVSGEQFEGALLAAAVDAGRKVKVLERRSAGADHPVLLACPETRHLKVLFCAVV